MAKISICIDVADLQRATTFYCDALGGVLEKRQETHNTLSLDGITLHLAEKEAGSNALRVGEGERSFERHWTPVHLDFDVPDVDEATAKVKQFGGTVEGIKRGDWGAAAFCADPSGNGFCLLAITVDH